MMPSKNSQAAAFATRLALSLTMLITILFNFACAPGGRDGAPASTGPTAPTAQGTVSGGGGNGCDGKAFEAHAEKITSFDEYRLYIRPLLHRMIEEGNDPFVSYLLWAAEEKTWYFVPCKLEKLSTEQIGVAIDSDQLARHGEHGIFIYGDKRDSVIPKDDASVPKENKHYFNQRLKVRAALLAHEMVMGARLLMKKSAKDQCKALAGKDPGLCSDPEVMAIAESKVIDPKTAMVMSAEDHDSVRAMTSYLVDKGSYLSAEKVAATRERLGYHFPWSRAVSKLDFAGFKKAVARNRQLRDKFVAGPEATEKMFRSIPTSCSIQLNQYDDKYLSFSISFRTSMKEADMAWTDYTKPNPRQEAHTKMGVDYAHTGCATTAGQFHVYEDENPDPSKGVYCKDTVLAWPRSQIGVVFQQSSFSARGILRNGVVYDEVAVTEFQRGHLSLDRLTPEAAIVRFWISRDANPRVVGYRVEPKQVLEADITKIRDSKRPDSKPATEGDSKRSKTEPPELMDIPGVPAIECLREPAS